MRTPNFSLEVFGYFNTGGDPEQHKEKPVYYYEFEFYTEDYPGGTITEGVFRPAKKGGFCLFKPGQPQRLVPPYRCYVVNIKTEDPQLKEILDNMPTFSMLWNMDEVTKLLRKMQAIEDRNRIENRLKLHSYTEQILALLLAYSQSPEQLDPNIIRHQTTLLAADRYIREHICEEISLKQLAQQSNLDPTYFHKLFTAAFGVTPAKQLLNYRIAAVKAGLWDEGIPLAELAERCGFSSASYLGSKFRQATGMTPTQYRKSFLRKK